MRNPAPSAGSRKRPPVIKVTAPIFIISFDRPDYLGSLCKTLRSQTGVEIDETQIFLMQDGAISAYSGNRYSDDGAIHATVETFRQYFPNGRVIQSNENLGIARNIRRAENIAFEELRAEVGYFFEDDLELGSKYLLAMETLKESLANTGQPVAYFAAYGDHRVDRVGDGVNVVSMDHHWGFGLFRQAWTQIDGWMQPYYELLDGTDYKYRNGLRIFELMEKYKVAHDKSSQDSMKTLACADLGLARVMTDACFARYMGKVGQSFTEQKFIELGYDKTKIYEPDEIKLNEPSAELLKTLVGNQLSKYRNFRETEYSVFVENCRRKNWNPDRLVDEQDIIDLYRTLLNRYPETAAIKSSAGKHVFRQLRQGILESQEFRGGTGLRFASPLPQSNGKS